MTSTKSVYKLYTPHADTLKINNTRLENRFTCLILLVGLPGVEPGTNGL
jgi:hypothetical protein